jgi:maltose operon periplasmic protein
MKLFNYMIVFFFLSLGGCTSLRSILPEAETANNSANAVSANNALVHADVCCNNYSSIQFKDVASVDEWRVTLDQYSPTYQFPEGKSYFIAYKLPLDRGGFTVSIASLFSKSVLIPQVMLLDGEFNVTRVIKSSVFKYKEPRMLRPEEYSGSFSIDRTHSGNIKNESYMIIYTPEPSLLQSSIVDSEEMRYAKTRALAEPRNGTVTIPHSAWGSLELSIEYLNHTASEAGVYIPTEVDAPASTGVSTPVPQQTTPIATKLNKENVESKILPETEAYYNHQIQQAVESKNMKKAISLYKEAKKLGSSSAETTLIKALE